MSPPTSAGVTTLLDHPIVKALAYGLMSVLIWFSNKQLDRLDEIVAKMNATEVSVVITNSRVDRISDRVDRTERDIRGLQRSMNRSDRSSLEERFQIKPGQHPNITVPN